MFPRFRRAGVHAHRTLAIQNRDVRAAAGCGGMGHPALRPPGKRQPFIFRCALAPVCRGGPWPSRGTLRRRKPDRYLRPKSRACGLWPPKRACGRSRIGPYRFAITQGPRPPAWPQRFLLPIIPHPPARGKRGLLRARTFDFHRPPPRLGAGGQKARPRRVNIVQSAKFSPRARQNAK